MRLLVHPAGPSQLAAQAVQKDRSARPQQVKGRVVPVGYVEGLNDARTMLAVFINSLLTISG